MSGSTSGGPNATKTISLRYIAATTLTATTSTTWTNWNDSGTLPDMPAVGYVEIPQVWPGFDHGPEVEYPVGCDVMGHGRVVQRVIQRPTEVAGAATNAGATNATSSTSRSTTTITTSAINSQVSGSNRRVTGVRGSDREFWEWLESVSSEDEWGEE